MIRKRLLLLEFEKANSSWLTDYAEFMAIKEYFGNKALQEWEDKRRSLEMKKHLINIA